MSFANDTQATKEDLSALHSALIALLVDFNAFKTFSGDPFSYAKNMSSLPQVYKNLVAGIDLEGLKTFRSIVSGTRRERFYLIFTEFFSRLSVPHEVDALIDEFFEQVTVRNGRDDSDLHDFVDFVERHRSRTYSELAKLDSTMYAASNSIPLEYLDDDESSQYSTYSIRDSIPVHYSRYSVKSMLTKNIDELSHMEPSQHYTLLYLRRNGERLKIVPLSQYMGELLYHRSIINPTDLLEPDRKLFDRLVAEKCMVGNAA